MSASRRIAILLPGLALLLGTAARAETPLVVGDTVEVTAEDVPAVEDGETVGTVDVAERFEVVRLEPDRVRIALRDGKQGWIPRSRVERVPAIEAGELIVVTAETANVMLGREVVATVRRENELVVLENREPWLRVRVAGRFGWIRDADVRKVENDDTNSLAAEYGRRGREWSRLQETGDRDAAIVEAKRTTRIAQTVRRLIEGNPDSDPAEIAMARSLVHRETSWLAKELIGPYDEPAEVVRLSQLGLSCAKLGHGSSDWRVTDARIALRSAVRRAGLSRADRLRLAEAQARTDRAVELRDGGKWREGLIPAREALAIRLEVLGEDHAEHAVSLNLLARFQDGVGDFAAARSSYERALAIDLETVGKENPAYQMNLVSLAVTLDSLGLHEAARSRFEEALATQRRMFGTKDDEILASTLSSFGVHQLERGEYTAARPLLEESLTIRSRLLGEEHPQYALGLTNLAGLYELQGDPTAAKGLLERALAIYRRAHGNDDRHVARTLNNLASQHETLGDFDTAQKLFEEALAIRGRVLGERHPDYAQNLNNLAVLHARLGDDRTARTHYENALAIARRSLGPDHPDCATQLNNIGALHKSAGRFDLARSSYDEALRIRRATLSPTNPDLAVSLQNLAVLDLAEGRTADARGRIDEGRRILRRHVARVLGGLAPPAQLRFLRTSERPWFESELSFALRDRDELETATLSAGWLLNGKSVAVESLAQSLLLARESNDPRAAPLVEELRTTRAELARESLRSVGPDEVATHRAKVDGLQNRVDELLRELGSLGSGVAGSEPWVELDDVRTAIPEGAALIEIARFNVRNFQQKTNDPYSFPPRYAAWIIDRDGPVRIVDLGEAAAIETAVADVRRRMADAAQRIGEADEEDVEQADRKALRALATLVLDPLIREIGPEVDRLILSPDGSLWLAPWAALPLQDGRYAVERFEIGYVVSGRDLVTRSSRSEATSPPLILADPDFDLDPESVATDAADVRGNDSTRRIPRVKRLPATAAEARAIRPGMQTFAGTEPAMFTGGDATEAVFKRVDRPRVVSVATHGFFLADQRVEPGTKSGLQDDTRSAVLTTDGLPIENPLLRCGLLLAGANERDRAAANVDDGVLTGAEIVGTDLRGTRLVVLSACETGIGEIQNGEGVAGLRQAFQLAGAESVVASLWQVDDLATARLMRDLFEHLAEPGTRRTAALQRAQLARIASRRERYGAAHPFYWAAFTLTGTAPGNTDESVPEK